MVMTSPWAVTSPSLAAGLPLVGIVGSPAVLVSSREAASVVWLSLRVVGFDIVCNGRTFDLAEGVVAKF